VQIAAALSTEAEMLEVYQRTPAWVLPKVDFDIPPLMRAALRLPGVVPAVNVAGRALAPRYGIMAKRPVISSAFLSGLNNPNTHLVTTPIERITRDGVRTVDGRDHPADLLVLATGYELWTDPETYRPGTVLGANGFDLAEYYRAHGPHSYAGTAHPRLPNPWEIVGPLGFVGFAWPCFVETTAAHAVRMIDETRRRGSHVAEVSQDAFNRWDATMARRGRTAHLYFTDCNPGLRTYFINSQRDTVYHRPQTITASRRFARRSPLADYEFTRRTVQTTPAPLPKEQPA
jgi:cation diffusion facilitator CzcD-associated flavoprotein CzcO